MKTLTKIKSIFSFKKNIETKSTSATAPLSKMVTNLSIINREINIKEGNNLTRIKELEKENLKLRAQYSKNTQTIDKIKHIL